MSRLCSFFLQDATLFDRRDLLNKNIVFANSKNREKSTCLIKYYTVCILQMTISWLLVKTIYEATRIEEVGVKEIVDFCLFVMSFQI